MKKISIVLCVALICAGAFYLLKHPSEKAVAATSESPKKILPDQEATNRTQGAIVRVATNNNQEANVSSGSRTNSILRQAVISKYGNISDLKQIPSLKLLQTDPGTQSWISDGVPISFQINGQSGKTANFTADFLDAEIDSNDGRIRELELHTPKLEINQIRELGLQLDKTLGLDSKNFLAWCEKVGNHWIDAPTFSSKAGIPPPDSNKIMGYGVHPTFNDEKPWFVIFILRDR